MTEKYPTGAKIPASFDHTAAFEEHIKPMLKQLEEACLQHGVALSYSITHARSLFEKDCDQMRMTSEGCVGNIYASMHDARGLSFSTAALMLNQYPQATSNPLMFTQLMSEIPRVISNVFQDLINGEVISSEQSDQ